MFKPYLLPISKAEDLKNLGKEVKEVKLGARTQCELQQQLLFLEGLLCGQVCARCLAYNSHSNAGGKYPTLLISSLMFREVKKHAKDNS